MKTEGPIDAVIAWVDGDDPAHRSKMLPYLNAGDEANRAIAAPTRFRSNKEIFFSVASILRFAPFIRKIFIVTDDQIPAGLNEFIGRNFPDNKIPVEIVDHKDIFRGYEQYLPIFNSISIATCLFRIPDLSENYVYFNDDVMLLSPVTPDDWFRDGKLVENGRWRNRAFDGLIDSLKKKKSFAFKNTMLNAADIAGFRKRYFHITHTPHTSKKSLFEDFYSEHPEVLEANISHRFRDNTQYSALELGFLLARKKGLLKAVKERELYMMPVNRGDGYVKMKIGMQQNKKYKWGCVQSLDMAAEADRKLVLDWLSEVIGVSLV